MMILKTNLLKYRHYVLAAFLACGGILTQSCSDRVDSVNFNVSVPQEIYAGEPVTFTFDGNPDYIVFYSGTAGNQYANHNRTNIGIDRMDISYYITQRYTTRQDFKEPILHVMVSEDFTGEQTAAAIQAATWTELSAQTGSTTAEKPFPVPNPDAVEQNPTGYARATNVDFSAYKDKKFFFAFKVLFIDIYKALQPFCCVFLHIKSSLPVEVVNPDGQASISCRACFCRNRCRRPIRYRPSHCPLQEKNCPLPRGALSTSDAEKTLRGRFRT